MSQEGEVWMVRLRLVVFVVVAQALVAAQTAAELNDAGLRQYDAGRFALAEESFRAALNARPTAEQSGAILNNLAAALQVSGKDGEALEAARSSLRVSENLYGKNSVRLAPPLNSVAMLYRRSDEHRKAVPLLERALRLLEAGGDSAERAATLHNLGMVYFDLGQISRAERLLLESASIHGDSAAGAPTLGVLAKIAADQGRFAEAESLYQRALRLRVSALGAQHPAVAITSSDLGELYTSMGRLTEAAELLTEAIDLFRAAGVNNHPSLTTTYLRLAELRMRHRDYVGAARTYAIVVERIERIYGADHANLAHVLPAYAVALRKAERKNEARAVEERVAGLRGGSRAAAWRSHTVDLKALLPPGR